MSLKTIFCGTPEFALPALEGLLNSKHQILAVYTQPDRPSGRGQQLTESPVKQLALRHQLPIYQPENLRDPEEQQTLQTLQADLMVVVAYGLILPKAVLAMPRFGAVNIHPSLLPRWRGPSPIQAALLAGESQTGVSIIKLTPKMDAGPILHQSIYHITNHETAGSLHQILAQQGAQDLLKVLDAFSDGNWGERPQEESQATYTRKINKTDAEIDWQKSAKEIEQAIRAYHPWPIAYTHYRQNILRIWEGKAISADHQPWPPGVLAQIGKNSLEVATGNGLLQLLTVQLPGGRLISVADFIHGQREFLQVGSSFR